MPEYSPQQKTLLGTHSSEISLNEWNFVHIRGPIPGRTTGCRAQCKSRFPPKGLAIMVQFRFWSAHFRTTDGSVDGGGLLGLCNWQNPCSTTHSSVSKARKALGVLET
jgi:hypothetical protein